MFCSKCGTKVEANARFCSACGYELPETNGVHISAITEAVLESSASIEAATAPQKRQPWHFAGLVFAWLLILSGLWVVLLSVYVQQHGRIVGQAAVYFAIGVATICAIRAPRRKTIWFFLGLIGGMIGLMVLVFVTGAIRSFLT